MKNADACEVCNPGTFNDGTSAICLQCPPDTYAEDSGQTACTACPDGAMTSGRSGSKTVRECACRMGSYGTVGDCRDCPVGKYSDRPGTFSCKDCPAFRNTSVVGAKSASQCVCIYGLYCYVLSRLGSFLNICLGTPTCVDAAHAAQRHVHDSHQRRNAAEMVQLPGYYQTTEVMSDSETKSVCAPCMDGKFKDILGNEECQQVCETSAHTHTHTHTHTRR